MKKKFKLKGINNEKNINFSNKNLCINILMFWNKK